MTTSEAILDSPAGMSDDQYEDEFVYRQLSTLAIASILLGVLSALTFIAGKDSLQACLMLCPIPVVGLVCGLKAMANIRLMPDQLSGHFPALAGTILSAIGLFGGLGFAGYVHATEVPPGYERVSFYNLRPDDVEMRGKELIPRDVKQLNEEEVFIKGYMRPGTHLSKGGTPVRHNVNRFLLVRDNNECCFGDLSDVKYYDKVHVKLTDNLNTDYSSGLFRMGGKLIILPPNPKAGQTEPTYLLEANYVK